jgi:hypothetical protein
MDGRQGPGYVFTGVFTATVKVAGLVIAVHEAFTQRNSQVLATAAFMMAGAQGLDVLRDFLATRNGARP